MHIDFVGIAIALAILYGMWCWLEEIFLVVLGAIVAIVVVTYLGGWIYHQADATMGWISETAQQR